MPISNVTTKRTQGASHQHIAIHLIDEWAIPDCMDWFVRPAAAWKLIETMNHSGGTICRIPFYYEECYKFCSELWHLRRIVWSN